ncbi:hypothetical protein VJI72_04775 [Parvimonas micra]|uniref:hypothetical protein n=1 Tax=Parvimonas micra TaxID=33033 RepID=UPI002B47BC35|nr:hypothetical protein [Parvimonas micra]MEB3029104.1 hypothetical protein [Parvimonas micra]
MATKKVVEKIEKSIKKKEKETLKKDDKKELETIKNEKKQVKRIKSFLKKLKPYYENLTPDEQIYAKNLAEEIAFMKIALEDLRADVNKNGVVTEMIQGDYSIQRENPALRSYNTTIKCYNSTIKQLDEFLNKNNVQTNNEEDRLLKFIQKK